MRDFTQEGWSIYRKLAREFYGLDIPSSLRGKLAGASLDLAIEHYTAVLRLIDAEHYGSAAALVRLEWESYLRGVWLYFRATDDELESVNERDKFPRLPMLVAEVEKHEAFNVGVLEDLRSESSDAMNSMTHGGMRQLSCRIANNGIRPNYTQNDLARVVDTATVIGIWTYGAMAQMAEATDKQAMLLSVVNFFQGSAPQD